MQYLQTVSEKPCGKVEAHNELNIKYDLQIVIPAYNVASYIKKCIDSILAQKTQYTYIITVVNDGSTDETKHILSKYVNNQQVNIINQDNKGFSGARNRGLEILTGKYLMFVDSDDYLCENAIENLLTKAMEWDVDIVEGSVLFVDDVENILSEKHHNSSRNKTDYADALWGQPWGKVIRSDIFVNLCFPEGFWYEDSIFEYCIYPLWRKKYTIEQNVYAYRNNLKGITCKSRGASKSVDHYWIMLYLWDWIADKEIDEKWLQFSMLQNMILGYSRTKDLGESVLQAGFVALGQRYVSRFDSIDSYDRKYKLLDHAVRQCDFGKFKLLCDRWRYI